MIIDPSTLRWRINNDSRFSILKKEEKAYILNKIFGDLGYGEPMEDEADIDSPQELVQEPFIEQDKYDEVWHRGSISYSKTPNERKGVIFHHTAGRYRGSLAWLKSGNVTASYHVIIAPDGTQHRLVDDRYRAYGAGRGVIKGRNPNHVCLHVAFEGDTQTGAHRDTRELSPIEIESAMEWLIPRYKKFGMSLDWTSDHRTTDPNRRNDLAPDQLERLTNQLQSKL